MTKIFVWAVEATGWQRGDVIGFAMTEDGRGLASHLSSGTEWAKHDMGVTSNWKHDHYSKHCPDGYELVWIDDPGVSDEWKTAFELNKKHKVEAEAQS